MRLEQIIKGLKEYDKNKNSAWIFDNNGDIKDDVIVGDVIPYLEEISEFEIEYDEILADEIKKRGEGFNTYNWGANISHDLQWYQLALNGDIYIVMSVHIGGDIRGCYTDEFMLKIDYDGALFEAESVNQYKFVSERYGVDINIFSELYTVYDNEDGDDIGEYYEIEVDDLLKEIASRQ